MSFSEAIKDIFEPVISPYKSLSVGIAVPTPLVATTFSTKASSTDALVYVRADGSVIKR